jgi:hypothetical protein
MNIEIDFPETLEDITLWALENATANNNKPAYFHQIWKENADELSGRQVHHQFCAWLTRIAQLEGAVTYKGQLCPVLGSQDYQVRVAGIFVCVLAGTTLLEMYNGELNEYQTS